MPNKPFSYFRALAGTLLLGWLLYPASAAHAAIQLTRIDYSSGDKFLASIAARTLDFMTILAVPLAVAGIFVMAFKLVTSAGNPEAFAQAKKNLLYIGTGIFLIVFAIIFVRMIAGFFF